MAQFGRALRSGRRGRKFKSCHLDQKSKLTLAVGLDFLFVETRLEKNGFASAKCRTFGECSASSGSCQRRQACGQVLSPRHAICVVDTLLFYGFYSRIFRFLIEIRPQAKLDLFGLSFVFFLRLYHDNFVTRLETAVLLYFT